MTKFAELIMGEFFPTVPGYWVVDCETSAELVDGEWESLPRALKGGIRPHIEYLGLMHGGTKTPTVLHRLDSGFRDLCAQVRDINGDELVVGHNIGFDYQHLRPVRWQLVWDTMIADYVLSAQKYRFSSLGELMLREAVLPPKEDLIGEYMSRGVAPQGIPREKIVPYTKQDLFGTDAVFRSQYARAKDSQRRLIVILSVASLAYADCSANGLQLDTRTSVDRRDKCFTESTRMAEGFAEVWEAGNPAARHDLLVLKRECARAGAAPTKWATTPTAMSSLFFNTPPAIDAGTIPAPELGARRVRRIVLASPLRNAVPPLVPPASDARGIRSTADDVLTEIQRTGVEPYASLAMMEQRRRENHKLGKTYYQALLEQADRYSGRVHPTIHSTTTATGRTSSSNPNIQNQPPETREVFIADEGQTFVEFDFQQLEMWALAVVSCCPYLYRALAAGEDVHYLTGIEAGMWSDASGMTKEGRRLVKRINFGLIYGGQAPGLAKQSRVSVNTTRKIINGFYTRFPGVKEYHDSLINWAAGKTTASPSPLFRDKRTETVLGKGGTQTDTVIETYTGRSYRFEQETTGKRVGLSPTKLKNYPIQGFGTGDFVPLSIACLWDALRPRPVWRAVIHDAALLSIAKGDEALLKTVINDAVDDAKKVAQTLWITTASLKLNVSFEAKDRWSPMEEDEETPT